MSQQSPKQPELVVGGLNFTSIAAGGINTCGISVNGSVFCWGYGWYGAWGNGSIKQASWPWPIAVIGGLNFSSITVGYSHVCGITVNRSVYCWGYSNYGQIGNGTITQANFPTFIPGLENTTSISTGSYFTCEINYTRNIEVTDSCSCPNSDSDWIVNMQDFCIINSDCNLGTGRLNFTGTGNFSVRAVINTTSMGIPTENSIIWMGANGRINIH